ncbi:thioredoxin-like protein [Trametes gibbosa]
MAPSEQITFYTAPFSPYALRVHIALEEANAKYTIHHIDVLQKRPDWYHTISPFGKVPAITFGGPEVPPDQPSSESEKLTESLALLEFIAEVFPEAKLLPAGPILRSRARAFISIYQNYVNDPFRQVYFFAKPADALLQALEKLQGALPPTGFAVGEWCIADAAVAPFLSHLFLYLREGLGKYSLEDRDKMRDALFVHERFSRLRRYVEDVRGRPGFKKAWVSDALQVELGWKIPPLRP